MALYSSSNLPALRFTFHGDEITEYRLRQGCIEFRKNHGQWQVLDEAEVKHHFDLHTQIANWLKQQLSDEHRIAAEQDDSSS